MKLLRTILEKTCYGLGYLLVILYAVVAYPFYLIYRLFKRAKKCAKK